ncbi:hypothetical protein FKM82_010132 [Ascaphus truei]
MNGTRGNAQQGQRRIGTLEKPTRFKNQDFNALREYHLKAGLRFKDETFPADNSTIGPRLQAEFHIRSIQWKRPPAFCEEPHLIVDGVSLFDICQSKLGDCWVLSTIGSITLKQNFLSNIMPLNQGYSTKYAGIFHFRFWHFGEWVDVVIDDKLPFIDGEYLCVQPRSNNEFWPCLLEKAYAKLLGSYQALHWGNPAEAFVNFTGGLAMTFDLKSSRMQADLWQMVKAASPVALMACTVSNPDVPTMNRSLSVPNLTINNDERRSSVPVDKIQTNIQLRNGLVESHAYTVTGTAQVCFQNGLENLIRLWNPWGHGEWTGRWSDSCPQWNEVTPQDRKRLYQRKDNGEFWMTWEDFSHEFSQLVICNRSPDFLDWGDHRRPWYKSIYWNSWPKESSASGFFNKDTFCKNPQYLIKVTGSDEVKKGSNVVITLMQPPKNRQMFIGDWLPIGFLVSQIQDQQEKLPNSFFTNEQLSKNDISKKYEVTKSFQLTAGRYVIVPYTTNRDQESSFLLQIFLKSEDCIVELGTAQSSKVLMNYEDNTYENIFKQYATQGLKMNAWDLQRSLNEVILKEFASSHGAGFTVDACRGMLALMDYSHTGRLDAVQFGHILRHLTKYKDIFNEIDINRSGLLDLPGLQKAVKLAGLFSNNDQLNQMILRYGDSGMRLNFTDYLCCMVRLHVTLKTFQSLSTDGKGVYVSQEKWMQLMMYS